MREINEIVSEGVYDEMKRRAWGNPNRARAIKVEAKVPDDFFARFTAPARPTFKGKRYEARAIAGKARATKRKTKRRNKS